MNQEIKKGVHIELELKEIRKENKHSYYIVTLNGEEHSIGMFPFQLDQEPAKTLHCYVKDVIDGKPLLVQDYSYLLKELYTVGQSYTFTVRRNFTQLPEPFYEVVDEKGIPLNLRKYGTAKLSERQKIECTVTALKGSHIELELKDYIKDDYVKFLTLNDVISIIGSEDEFVTRWIEPNLLKQPWLMLAREKYEQRDPEWLFTAILALKEHLSEWVDPEKDYVERMLSAFLKLILYLLEESDIMRKMAAQERRLMRQNLSQLAMDVKDYQTASAYIIGNASESFVEELFRKMNTSGYLFEPDKKLRILKCMFSISPTLLQDHIEAIFNTLNGKDRETWMKEPFRTSFIAILELYIRKNSPNADFELNTNSAAGMKLMEKLIRALAIQLLMTNNDDDIDRPLNRSMLYRYCTFFNATYQQKLLDNAFLCLSQAEQSRLEYTWADINDIRTLANKLAFSHSSETGKIHYVQYFKSSTMQLRLFNDAIQVLPASHEELAKRVLPA